MPFIRRFISNQLASRIGRFASAATIAPSGVSSATDSCGSGLATMPTTTNVFDESVNAGSVVVGIAAIAFRKNEKTAELRAKYRCQGVWPEQG
jgi:hypothetical protein